MHFQRTLVAVAGLLMLTGAAVAATAAKHRKLTDEEEIEAMLNPHVQLIILGTSKDYHKLEAEARAIAKRAGMPYYMEGTIYDNKKGLVCTDDPMWAGAYLCRRDSCERIKGKESHFISIERSEGYPGMKEGYYIIVADVCSDAKKAKAALAKYRKVVAGAYACGTEVYMGCRH